MKKKLSMILLFVAVCMNCLAVSETTIIRHSGDQVYVYEGYKQLASVLQECKDGDVLYLSAGQFDGFAIEKK